jgi:hypothetical protein
MTTPPNAPRPEPVAAADLVAQAREPADEYRAEGVEDAVLLAALADALEARDRRIAELEAGLRRIVNGVAEQHANDDPRHEGALREIKRLASDLLAGRAAGAKDHT